MNHTDTEGTNITAQGLLELAVVCPDLSELYLSSCGGCGAALSQLKQRLPSLRVAFLGAAITPATLESLLDSYAQTQQLDLTADPTGTLGSLSPIAISELVAMCPDAQAIFFGGESGLLYSWCCVCRPAGCR